MGTAPSSAFDVSSDNGCPVSANLSSKCSCYFYNCLIVVCSSAILRAVFDWADDNFSLASRPIFFFS